ncbi:hypothetical protein [Rothia sp. ZJ1223]|uniref:hypothetical protein n=1 Tax=Rothia sp. ZJ1223 TaxID=2811098 RepID=UPI001EF68182|nr:hypothetical protein [Rothia sp. ZJ1223]
MFLRGVVASAAFDIGVEQGLDVVPYRWSDDWFVVATDVVLGYFAGVFRFLLGEKVDGVALL